MKKIKKVLGIILVATLMLSLAGCVEVEMGVAIEEDGTSSMTAKLFIEEDSYNTLKSLGSDASSSTGDLDLNQFKKETVEDKVYYTFSETESFKSYEALEAALLSSGDEEGTQIFSSVDITKAEGDEYSFSAVTAVAETANAEAMGLPEDWLKVSLTVSMPGKVSETNGEKLEAGTVKFLIDDFAKEHTFSVKTVPITFTVRELVLVIAFFAIIGGTIAFLVWRRKKGYRF